MSSVVTVRMYVVGFGDCFLVTIPTSDGPRRILVDCGSIKLGAYGPRDAAVAIQSEPAFRDASGRTRIDVVVGTHRHADHVSGFELAGWDDVEVGEVWLPWTEDPDDPEATRIRTKQGALALALKTHVAALGAAAPELHRFLAANNGSNETAMRRLHHGFRAPSGAPGGRAPRRFLPQKDAPSFTYETDVLPGVKVHVLGPSFDAEVIRDMDPEGSESYLESLSAVRGATRDAAVLQAFPGVRPLPVSRLVPRRLALAPWEEKAVADLSTNDLFGALVSLDTAVNGTSLMIVLEVPSSSGEARFLLLPGDAQRSTWIGAMDGAAKEALLRRTDFYKIGHHGSHNATPRKFVETVLDPTKRKSAMASVTPYAKWKHIPLPEVIDKLRGVDTGVVRSDELGSLPPGFRREPTGRYVEVDIPL